MSNFQNPRVPPTGGSHLRAHLIITLHKGGGGWSARPLAWQPYLELGNHAEAVKWWRKAGEQGHVQAQHNVGIAHENGEGVAKDFVEVAKWFRLAAEQGNAESQYALGKRYFRGEGARL